MTSVEQTYAELFKLAAVTPEVAVAAKKLLSPWLAAGGGAALGLAAAPLAYGAGKANAQRANEAALADAQKKYFLGGLASGVVGAPLLKGVLKGTGLGLTGDLSAEGFGLTGDAGGGLSDEEFTSI